jgi:protoporphyrinogen oxidase
MEGRHAVSVLGKAQKPKSRTIDEFCGAPKGGFKRFVAQQEAREAAKERRHQQYVKNRRKRDNQRTTEDCACRS